MVPDLLPQEHRGSAAAEPEAADGGEGTQRSERGAGEGDTRRTHQGETGIVIGVSIVLSLPPSPTSQLLSTAHYFSIFFSFQDLRSQLDAALQEMDDLRERRERQKEMVEAIVKQRDMYRTLLAQATPLPQESPQVRKTDNMVPATSPCTM